MKYVKNCAKCNKPFTTTDDSVVLCRACANAKEKAEAAAELERQNQVLESIQCEGCGKTFDFTVGEKEFYTAHGMENNPKYCKDCRKTIREMKKKLGGDTAICKECGKPFFYSNQYLLACARNGWDPSPRCPACRAKNARRAEDVRRRAIAMTATCKDCGKEFIITVGEKEFFEKNYDHVPVRCRDCRRKRRVNALVKDMRAEAREAELDTVPAMTEDQTADAGAVANMPPVSIPAPETLSASAAAADTAAPIGDAAFELSEEQKAEFDAELAAEPSAEDIEAAEMDAAAAEVMAEDDTPAAEDIEQAEMNEAAAEVMAEDDVDVPADQMPAGPAPKAEDLFQPVDADKAAAAE